MRIAVIEPSLYHRSGKLIRKRKLGYFGQTLVHLATLIPPEHEIEAINDILDEPDYTKPYDLVLLTSMGPTMERAIEIATEYRKRKVPCVVGGYAAWLYKDRVEGLFDSIAIGEAEMLLPPILSDAGKGKLAPLYESGDLHPLSGLPPLRLDALDLERYGVLYPIHATRGCGHRCDFCDRLPRRTQRRPGQGPEDVDRPAHVRRVYAFQEFRPGRDPEVGQPRLLAAV